MESPKTPSPGQWAPWIEDPDEPQPPMSDEELKRFGEKAAAWLEKKRREERSRKPDKVGLRLRNSAAVGVAREK